MLRIFSGIVELRPWSGGAPRVFLGTEVPVVAELAHVAPAPEAFTCRMEADISRCTRKLAEGKFELRFLVRNPDGPTRELRDHMVEEVFTVDGKDVVKLLRRAVGRRARLVVEFRERAKA